MSIVPVTSGRSLSCQKYSRYLKRAKNTSGVSLLILNDTENAGFVTDSFQFKEIVPSSPPPH